MASPPTPPIRIDPLNRKYFVPLERIDTLSSIGFYAVAILSVSVLFIDPVANPKVNDGLNVAFLVLTIVLFSLGLATRLYFAPRAEDARRQEFYATAFNVSLISDRTVGYYNNNISDPIKRSAAMVLENSLFSKNIVLKMLHRERLIYLIYITIWIAAALNRRTDMTFIVASAQAVFSEQIIARWLRLEWLRTRFEETYDKIRTLFVSGNEQTFQAYALTYISAYETTKASGSISLSSKIFRKLNPELSIEWEQTKISLGI